MTRALPALALFAASVLLLAAAPAGSEDRGPSCDWTQRLHLKALTRGGSLAAQTFKWTAVADAGTPPVEPQCATDAGALLTLARSCTRSRHCVAMPPPAGTGLGCCVPMNTWAFVSDFPKALQAVAAAQRTPDGGTCGGPLTDPLCRKLCDAECVGGRCEVKRERFP